MRKSHLMELLLLMRSLKRKNLGFAFLSLAFVSWLCVALDHNLEAAGTNAVPITVESPGWPGVPGSVFAFRDARFSTPFVAFDATGRVLMDFNCATRGRALFGRFFELVCDGGYFQTGDAGRWIGLQVAKSGAFTIEVTLTPVEAAPNTREVVLSFCDDKGEDIALLQDKSGLSLKCAGTSPINLFMPEAGKAIHVLITCDKERWVAYRDGHSVNSGPVAAGATKWGERQLVMGATWSGADPWRGRMEGIAVFPRALTADESAGEATAIKVLQTGRKPAAKICFRGTLLRQAQTSDVKELRGYTRSLTVAEYKIDQVLSGEWKQATIMVMHWMIIDRQRLSIADRAIGTAVELTVERYSDHPELEECRRNDEMEGVNDTDQFYCESESVPCKTIVSRPNL